MRNTSASKLKWFTIALTLVGFPLIALAQTQYCVGQGQSELCLSFLERFIRSRPNEIGDTLAGIFGTLAFLAAAIAIVMQASELAAQREELRLTRLEYERQREATEEMAKAMGKQSAIFEDERQFRAESRAKEVFDQLLESLREGFERAKNARWEYTSQVHGGELQTLLTERTWAFRPSKGFPGDEYFIELFFYLDGLNKALEKDAIAGEKPDFHAKPTRSQREVAFIKSTLDKLSRVYADLSDAEKERYQRLRISPTFFEVQKLMSHRIYQEDEH